MKHDIKYIDFITIINQNNDNLELLNKIKSKYINLLSELTNTSNTLNIQNEFEKKVELELDIDIFLSKIKEIHKYGKIFIAIVGNLTDEFEIVGSTTVFIEQKIIHNAKCVAHIEDVVVDKKFRGIGIAKNIIELVKKYSFDNNCYKIILNCKKEYILFYEKMGFSNKNCEMSLYFD
jgi:GNAT superfamily N-acetyltransferase